jgi:PAS domain S-box-containing protein
MENKINLREEAEKKIEDGGGIPPARPLSAEEAQCLIHELEVYQIELEMQNLELRTAQLASEASRQRYADLYDFAPVGYFTFDRDGLVLEANLTGAGQLNRERSRIIKRPFIVFLPPEDRTPFGQYVLRLFDHKRKERLELKINGKDGSFDAQLDSAVVKDPDGAWVCRTVVSDISQRKRAERETKGLNAALEEKTAELQKTHLALQARTKEAEESNRLKSELIANVSHELRTPLHAIIGYSQLFLGKTYGSINPEQAFPLDRILKNAEALRGLVDNILDLAKIRAGKLSLEIRPVKISSLIQEVVSQLKPAFEEKELFLTLDVQEDLPWILSDLSKVRQILIGLLSNAAKFTLHGGATITVLERKEEKGIDIMVADTGIGIREEELSLIFTSFCQVDGSQTREFGGTGLGLAIVKELTHLLNGEIQVESEFGHGSTFTLSLQENL